MNRRVVQEAARILISGLVGWGVCAAAGPAESPPDGSWPPFDPGDLQRRESAIEPGADAEYLLRTIQIDHSINSDDAWSTRRHFFRVQVFTDAGIEEFGVVEIPFSNDLDVHQIRVRVLRPDGSFETVDPAAVLTRENVRRRKEFTGVKTIAIPGLCPGAVIDCQWLEVERITENLMELLPLHAEVPARHLRYEVRSLPYAGAPGIWWLSFNTEPPPRTVTPLGRLVFEAKDVRSVPVEPWMPPLSAVAPWLLLYYNWQPDLALRENWDRYARDLHGWFDQRAEKYASVEATARELAGTDVGGIEAMARLHEYCRHEIVLRPSSPGGAGGTSDRRESLRTPKEILAAGEGSADEVRLLFAAMARSIGRDARLAVLSDRREFPLDPERSVPEMLDGHAVAVECVGGWRFFDPGTPALPAGMLAWWNEGAPALLSDPRSGQFITVPRSPGETTGRVLGAELRLTAGGDLEGWTRMTWRGHSGIELRLEHEGDDAGLADLIRARFGESLPGGRIDSLEIAKDDAGGVTGRAFIRWPGYAQLVGRRMLLQPFVFRQDGKPMFKEETRRHPVVFPYAQVAVDSIRIHLPEEFRLAEPDTGAVLGLGPYASFESAIREAEDGRSLLAERRLAVRAIRFELPQYPHLRGFFAAVQARDAMRIVLDRIR